MHQTAYWKQAKYCKGNRYYPSHLQLLQRRNVLYNKSTMRRLKLEESYKFQMFERDCDETKIWINEKLKAASDEGYLVSIVVRDCKG